MDRRRLIFYILLNIVVSACVTLTILYWYDRNYRAATLPPVAAPVISSGTNPVVVPTLQQGTVKIISVVGAGTLSIETVTIQYTGNGELDLTAWHLKDSNGNDFIFPPFKLFTNGAVRVHTASGTNTAVDLYWGNNKAAWSSGENVVLTDPQGNAQDSYPVP
ncbi:MAG TPA: lamin tail domain-containing protein [Anaerolineales bacterium]|nr:lamin tail domain-containing protein [Anaerolineales bacterium]